MSIQRRVALMMDCGNGYFREATRGICRYAEPVKPWLIRMTRAAIDILPRVLDWKPDGIIASAQDLRFAEILVQSRIPTVNLSAASADVRMPCVHVDDVAVGKMAAEHFIERGFHHFAFVGLRNCAFSSFREEGYKQAVQNRKLECLSFYLDMPSDFRPDLWQTGDENIEKFLAELPRPCAVFVASDTQCHYLAELCHHVGLHVPEDLALLGVDNDELFCELAYPRLSSVRAPSLEIGYAAASMLERMMDGERPPKEPILLPPMNVVTRQSTDILAIEDPDIAASVRFIRTNAARPLSVDDILNEVPISRRALESKFRIALGRSPHDEISRVRIDRSRELLAMTDLPMPAVASQAGFTNAERLSVVFKRKTGMTPTEYRDRYRASR